MHQLHGLGVSGVAPRQSQEIVIKYRVMHNHIPAAVVRMHDRDQGRRLLHFCKFVRLDRMKTRISNLATKSLGGGESCHRQAGIWP